jgi:FtsH-binding integral membrane protein
MFQKLFLTVFIALTVALLSFFVEPSDINSRSGLLIGSLFAAVANQYVVGSSLPLAGTVTLVDTIHQLAYLVILVCLGLSLLSFKCAKDNRAALSRRIDRSGFWALLVAYGGIVAVVVGNAVAKG